MAGWPEGFGRLLLEELDSTNLEARRRAPGHRGVPQWIAARRQTAGRGRLDRRWETGEGNLAATLLTSYRGSPGEAVRTWAFVAALATCDTVAGFAPGARVAIKWPNDVLLNGGKVAGILLEDLGRGANGGPRLAVGVGINLASHPDPTGMTVRPTSIARECGRAPGFEEALAVLAARVDHWHHCAASPGGYKALLDAWRARLVGLGKPITVRLPGEMLTGVFEGIDEEGHLLLRTAGGMRRIAAGDVHLRE